LSFSSFSEAFLFACSWFVNFSLSFCNCCIFCWTLSTSLSIASSSSSSSLFSWIRCFASCSRVCVVFSALALWRASRFALRSWSVMFEGSGMERFSCLRRGGALLDRSQREYSSLISFAVASWAVFQLKHGGRQCWGSEKLEGIPEHKNPEHKSQKLWRGDKESPKLCTCLKSCEPPYTCPRTPLL
jgi:hypothetical protein